jgi:hypothetical protein
MTKEYILLRLAAMMFAIEYNRNSDPFYFLKLDSRFRGNDRTRGVEMTEKRGERLGQSKPCPYVMNNYETDLKINSGLLRQEALADRGHLFEQLLSRR